MLKLWGSRQEDLETYRDIADDVEESEFVPFACHFNPHTILTKNGELLQTLKITGLKREVVGSDHADLRAQIREAVRNHIPSDAYALWFHTIRRKRDLSARGNFENAFARELDDAWEQKNHFRQQYTNEVFLTVVREGQSAPVLKKDHFVRGILPGMDIKWRNDYLDGIFAELEGVVDSICGALSTVGAERIGVYEENGIYYSELLEFLEKLTNLVDRKMPLPDEDLSSYLTNGEITFGFNAMEVRVADKRRFSSIVSLKEYKEASLPAIDAFLQSPMEFIVTQCVDFINPNMALKQYLQQKAITDFAEDSGTLAKLSELDAILKSDRKNPIDFGQQQLSIFLIGDSLRQVEIQTRMTIDFFKKCGMVAIREDLHFEQCYWAQLPGNFEFIARLQPTYTMHTAGFANLHNFPMGNEEGSIWGTPVSTFHTANGTPYFFNFHDGHTGHSWIVGKADTGKTVLANFLLAQATKFNPQIFYIDAEGRGVHAMQALEVSTYDLAQEGINPFSLPMTPENKQFLTRWMGVLIRITGKQVDEHLKPLLERAVEHVLMLPETQRHFASFVETLEVLSPGAQTYFADWLPGGSYGACFASRALLPVTGSHYFDVSGIMKQDAIRIPLISLLIQVIENRLNGLPSILYLNNAISLLENTHVAMNMAPWLDKIARQNAIAVFSSSPEASMEYLELMRQLLPYFATQIYMPDDDATEMYQDVFGLNEDEIHLLSIMEVVDHHFLIKQRGGSIVAELNLNGFENILETLSGKTSLHIATDPTLPSTEEPLIPYEVPA